MVVSSEIAEESGIGTGKKGGVEEQDVIDRRLGLESDDERERQNELWKRRMER